MPDGEEFEPVLRSTPVEPRGQVIGRLDRVIGVATEIANGLQGKPFSWRGVDAQHRMPIARMLGVTLISKSRAERLGFQLKRGQQPVGARYFEAPISAYHDVYVLECQFNRVEAERKPE